MPVSTRRKARPFAAAEDLGTLPHFGVSIVVILGLYWDNGKESGNYHFIGLSRV